MGVRGVCWLGFGMGRELYTNVEAGLDSLLDADNSKLFYSFDSLAIHGNFIVEAPLCKPMIRRPYGTESWLRSCARRRTSYC